MPKTILNGALISGSGLGGSLTNPIHTGEGRVIALVMSHTGVANRTVTLYDATSLPAAGTEIAAFVLEYRSPFQHLRFPRDEAIPFSTGLCVDVPATTEVLIWSLDYG